MVRIAPADRHPPFSPTQEPAVITREPTIERLAIAEGLSSDDVTALLSPDRLALTGRAEWKRAVKDRPDEATVPPEVKCQTR